ncbi:CC180 protein, partial [Heliornis fulica]|nr:CC180 protein [Heliornis fulica]
KDLPTTFECCAEMLKQKLLSYQRQTEHYYSSCLTEFQDQVKVLEKELPRVSWVATDNLLREHEQKLCSSTAQIQHHFSEQLKIWEKAK